MTKKDYELIAAAISYEFANAEKTYGIGGAFANANELASCNVALNRVANSIATHLHEQNRRFNRERFLQACGVRAFA